MREDRADLRDHSGDMHYGQWQDVRTMSADRFGQGADRFGQNYARDNGHDYGLNDMQRAGESGWHAQRLTPTTLASNAAEEKKSPTTRNLQHAWYQHFW